MLEKVKGRNEKLKQELDDKQSELDNPRDITDIASLEKELSLWRRKFDDLHAKTEKKKIQL